MTFIGRVTQDRLSVISVWPFMLVALLAATLTVPFARARAGMDGANGSHLSGKRLDCGYDARGAEDELSNHRLNSLRRGEPDATRSVSISSLQNRGPSAEDISDTAVFQDNGTLVIPPAKFNLKNRSILFTPDGDLDGFGYRISTDEIDFNSDFGSRLGYFLGSDGELEDADNAYRDVNLQGAQFPFFGVAYDTIYIGTNGYITFTRGDTSARISPSALATELPRIAPLWADLEEVDSGNVYYSRLNDRHIITWNKAGQPSYDGLSTFQAVLYDDGRIAFVYKKVKAQAALVGISPGNSAAGAQPVDFSNPPSERLTGPLFETFAKEKRLDLPAIMRAFYGAHSDSYDTVYIWTNFAFDNGLFIAHTFNIRNNISGIGLSIFDRGPAYGSPAGLGSIIAMGNVADWPKNPDAYMVGLNSAISIVCHEQGHLWLAYIHFDADNQVKDDLLGRQNSHWSFLADTRTSADGGYSSLMEGNAWRDSGAGIFTTIESAVNYFTPLDQYLMGLRAANEVGDIPYLVTDPQLKEFLHEKSPAAGFSMSAVRKTASVAQIVDREGPRVPDVTTSPKVFRIAFIALTEQGSTLSSNELEKVSSYRNAIVGYFSTATGGRGSLDASLNR